VVAELGSWEALLAPVPVEVVSPCVPPAERPAGSRELVNEALLQQRIEGLLVAAARSRAPVTLLINDTHRATDSRSAVDAILSLAAAHSRGEGPVWRLLVAAGSHRFGDDEKRRHEEWALGRWAPRFAARAWHAADDPGCMASVGPQRLHRWVVESPLVIAVGSVEPHYFAGFTGAHKTLTVGVMSMEDLRLNHAAALIENSAPLVTDGNPVHDGIAATLRRLEEGGRRMFAVNEVLVDGRLLACHAGHPLAALRAAIPAATAVYARTLDRPVDLAIARVGAPLDRSLYQADKGFKNVEAGVRDGGAIVLEAACPEGAGPHAFLDLLDAGDLAACLRRIERRGYCLGDHKAIRLRRLTGPRRIHLAILSAGVSPGDARRVGATLLSSRAEAAAWARGRLQASRGGRAVVVEDAGQMTLAVRGAP